MSKVCFKSLCLFKAAYFLNVIELVKQICGSKPVLPEKQNTFHGKYQTHAQKHPRCRQVMSHSLLNIKTFYMKKIF